MSSEEKKNSSLDTKSELLALLKNTLIMLLITLVAGGILGTVYVVTKEPIAQMEASVKEAANRKVFANADSFSEDILSTCPVTDEIAMEFPKVTISGCIEAFDSDLNSLGYVIEVTSHEGYGGDIVFAVGISNANIVNGISITSISETAGLGMRAEEVLVPQFKNRIADVFTVTKSDSILENQINAISSATITSKAVTNGVNAALKYYQDVLQKGEDNE